VVSVVQDDTVANTLGGGMQDIFRCMMMPQCNSTPFSVSSALNVVCEMITKTQGKTDVLGIVLNIGLECLSLNALSHNAVDALQLVVAIVLLVAFERTQARTILETFSSELCKTLKKKSECERIIDEKVVGPGIVLFAAEFLVSYRKSESKIPSDKAMAALRSFLRVASWSASVETAFVSALETMLTVEGDARCRNRAAHRKFHSFNVDAHSSDHVIRLLNILSVGLFSGPPPRPSDSPVICYLVRSLLEPPPGQLDTTREDACRALACNLRQCRVSPQVGLQVGGGRM